MLIIRSEQMRIFESAGLAAFEDRMVTFAMTKRPGLAEIEARDLVRHAIATGAEHEITTEGPIAVLVELMTVFGRNFELSPYGSWARTTLADKSKPGRLRVMLLRNKLTAGVGGRTIVPVE